MLMIFLGVAVDQRHFARITQRGREDVGDVVVVHLLRRTLFGRDDDLPGLLHLLQAEFGWLRRILLDVAGHQIHVSFGHFARGQPVGHASGRAVGNEDLQVIGALAQRDIRGQRLAGGALAQHAVATGATLEIDLAGTVKLGLRHLGRFGVGAWGCLPAQAGTSAACDKPPTAAKAASARIEACRTADLFMPGSPIFCSTNLLMQGC
jgi:hypothetical protein